MAPPTNNPKVRRTRKKAAPKRNVAMQSLPTKKPGESSSLRARLRSAKTVPDAEQPVSVSNLRARLRSVDSVPDVKPKAEAPAASNSIEELSQTLRASFNLTSTSGSSSKVTKAPKKAQQEHEAVKKLKELFAKYGLDLYKKAADDIVKAHTTIDGRTQEVSIQSSKFVSEASKLYSNVTAPLSKTRCHGDKVPSATVEAHLSNLLSGLKDAQKQLEDLQKQWEETFVEECDAWREYYELQRKWQLEDLDLERDISQLKSDIRAINREYEEKMDEVEAKCKADLQAESTRLFKSWE